jgi:hypothetical protein
LNGNVLPDFPSPMPSDVLKLMWSFYRRRKAVLLWQEQRGNAITMGRHVACTCRNVYNPPTVS